jgi:hypothetical protein
MRDGPIYRHKTLLLCSAHAMAAGSGLSFSRRGPQQLSGSKAPQTPKEQAAHSWFTEHRASPCCGLLGHYPLFTVQPCELAPCLCCSLQVPKDYRVVPFFCSQVSQSTMSLASGEAPLFSPFSDVHVFFTDHLILHFEGPAFPFLSPSIWRNGLLLSSALPLLVYWLPSPL